NFLTEWMLSWCTNGLRRPWSTKLVNTAAVIRQYAHFSTIRITELLQLLKNLAATICRVTMACWSTGTPFATFICNVVGETGSMCGTRPRTHAYFIPLKA